MSTHVDIEITTARPDTAGHGDKWTVLLCSVAVFLIALELTIISVALPEIEAAFPDSSRATLSWIFTAYNVGVASLMLIAGWCAERFGRKRVFQLGMLVFAVGSVVSGAAPTVLTLIAGRAVQAIGGAMLMPASLALILHGVSAERRDAAIGVWGAMAGLAAAVGPTLGAVIVDIVGWRSVFLINVPIAIIAYGVGRRRLTETRNPQAPTRVDLAAPPIGAAGVGLFVFAIIAAGARGLLSMPAVVSGCVGIVLVAIFAYRTHHHAAPLFPPELIKIRSYRVGAIGSLFFGAGFTGWLVLAPTFLVETWGYSIVESGLAVAPAPLAMAIVARPAGRLAGRLGHRVVVAAGALLSLAAIVVFATQVGTTPTYLTSFLPGAILIGAGVGTSFPMLTAASMRDVPSHQYAVGAAGNTTVRQAAMALGISIAIAIVGTPETTTADLDAFQLSWTVAGACFVATAGVIAILYPNAAATVTINADQAQNYGGDHGQ